MISLGLAACTAIKEAPVLRECTPCPEAPACPAPPKATATARPLQAANWEDLPGWVNDNLVAALPAFLESCKALARRPQWPLWKTVCEAANTLGVIDNEILRLFFESNFEPYLLTNPNGTTEGMVTGYYEPLLRGSRTKTSVFSQPVLGVPDDLLTIDLSSVLPELRHMRLRGRLQGNRVVPYYSRAEITEANRRQAFNGPTLLWVDDAIELFFLHIQGSGRVQLPDGQMVRIGYADHNGHPYVSIGRTLINRGELKFHQASMQGIQAWGRANPGRLEELLNTNPSFVFFQELASTGGSEAGPIGALGVPLTNERSIAVDPRYTPLGAPVFLATTRPNSPISLQRLMMAQDTGSAIRGVVRADFFWGFGADAGSLAGKMRQQGKMWVLLPRDSAASFMN